MNLKRDIQKLLFPLGSVQTIKFGYLTGKKIIVSENTQWAPLFGRWEPAMQKIIANVLKKGDTVYDLGANFGLHGLLSSQLIGENGTLYNFEPLPFNLDEITSNYKLNHVSNYYNIGKAVSNSETILNFSIVNHAGQGKIVEAGSTGKSIQVKSITLDKFIEEVGKLPNFIKMDIEGAEGDALEGFTKNIEKSFPLMIIELHNPEADKKVGAFLKEYKYKAYRFNTFHHLEFEEIKDLTLPYPHKEGIWGSVFCIGPNESLSNYKFNR